MRVALLTCFNKEYADIADVALPIMQRYCDKHGYGLKVGLYHTDPTRLATYGDRGKIDLYNQHYAEHDILVFMDIDVVIMNSEVYVADVLAFAGRPELAQREWPNRYDATTHSLVPDLPLRPFLWTLDNGGPCSGFWIARCIPSVRRMLLKVQTTAPLVGNVRTSFDPGPPARTLLALEPTGQSDQEVMRSLMHVPPFSDVLQHCVRGKDAGHCYLYDELGWEQFGVAAGADNINDYEPGDFLITFPSMPLNRRLEKMKEYASMAV